MKIALALSLLSLHACTCAAAATDDSGDAGERLYRAYCISCHGMSGKGDGPVGDSLGVRPTDHTRDAMNQFSDHFLFEIISKGGSGVGRSPLMPAWRGVLKDRQVRELVRYIRGLARRSRLMEKTLAPTR